MEDLSGVRLKSHAPFLEEGERVIALSYSASSAAVGTSYGQCNLSSLRHEILNSSAVGSFIFYPHLLVGIAFSAISFMEFKIY